MTSQAAAWAVSALIAVAFAAAPILLVSCLTFLPRSVNFMAGSGIRGLGNTAWMFWTQVFGTVFIVSLGRLLIFAAGLGVKGLFIAMLADEGVRSLVNSIRFFGSVKRSAREAA
jgi:Na+-driven multidrug efflux pump